MLPKMKLLNLIYIFKLIFAVKEFNMDEEFGAVTPEGAEDMGVLELNAGGAGYALAEIALKNPYMGFGESFIFLRQIELDFIL